MSKNTELGQSRLDSLYVIADPVFDSLESAIQDIEEMLGLSTPEIPVKVPEDNPAPLPAR